MPAPTEQPRRPLPSPPPPGILAALSLVMFTGGLGLGVAAGPATQSSLAAQARRVIAVVQPAPAAAPAPGLLARAPEAPEEAEPESEDEEEVTAAAAEPEVLADVEPAEEPVPVTEPAPEPAPVDDPADAELPPASALPPVKHVWVISLTQQRYEETWGPDAVEPSLAPALRARGTLLPRSFSVAHGAVPGGVALLSGQLPNPATRAGCATASPLDPGTVEDDDPLGQATGTGCRYPATVKTLPDQLTGAGLTWKAYVESIADPDPERAQTCRHAEVGQPDPFTAGRPGDPYVAARNPFVFFASIVEDPVCGANVVGLDRLAPDLADPEATPSFSYIVPDACHDGRAVPCAEGAPAGLAATGPWLTGVVDQITATDAYRESGLVLITADEAPADGPLADTRVCACATGAPSAGGGRVGTLLLSPFVTPGATVPQSYDQVSLLKSIEDLFGLAHLGAAADPAHKPLGPKVYAAYTPPS